jgi:exopolysaccharide biosynthesis protein
LTRAQRGRAARNPLLAIVAALAIVSIAAGFLLREPIERAVFLHSVADVTGIAFDADSIERSGDGYELHGLRASTRGGGALVDAPSATVALTGHHLSVALQDPHFTFDLDRYRSVRRALGDASLDLRVTGGTLSIVAGDVPVPLVAFDAVAGSLRASATAVRYDVSLALVDGDLRYPITGATAIAADGTETQTWNAPFLPIAPLTALLQPGTGVRFESGSIDDLAVTDGAKPSATARLDDVALVLGGHELTGVHGSIVVDGGGIGSRELAGTLDGAVPIDGAGEVHDLAGRFAWLRDGSPDLAGVADLVATIASEPRLRSVRVETAAPGLAYAQYAITGDHGPIAVSVLAIEPHEPTLHFDTAIAEDHVISGGERTSAMGVRTGAVGGVNGDYFDIGRTYQPQGLLIRSGELLRGPTDRAALAIDASGHVTFAEFHLDGVAEIAGRRFAVTQFNNWPAGGGDVTVITPRFGKTLQPAPGVTFATLDSIAGDATRFRIRSVVPATAPIPVEFGLAFGPDARAVLHPGQSVRLTYALDPPVPGAVAAIGGGPILIKDGAWYEDPHAPAPDERDYRWPVVALARKADDRLMLVAVDGRHPERSVGMTRPEFGDLLLRLGAVDAMALDSGGSVTLVSRAPGDTNVSVRNVPSDNSAERWVSDALFLYSSAPQPAIVPPLVAPTPVPEARPTP